MNVVKYQVDGDVLESMVYETSNSVEEEETSTFNKVISSDITEKTEEEFEGFTG